MEKAQRPKKSKTQGPKRVKMLKIKKWFGSINGNCASGLLLTMGILDTYRGHAAQNFHY